MEDQLQSFISDGQKILKLERVESTWNSGG